MTDAKKTDEQREVALVNAAWVALGKAGARNLSPEDVAAAVTPLIQAVRADRDAERALDRAIVEAAERWRDAPAMADHSQAAALILAVDAKRSATSSPSVAGRKDGERG